MTDPVRPISRSLIHDYAWSWWRYMDEGYPEGFSYAGMARWAESARAVSPDTLSQTIDPAILTDWPHSWADDRHIVVWKGVSIAADYTSLTGEPEDPSHWQQGYVFGQLGAPYRAGEPTYPNGPANWCLSPLGAIKNGFGNRLIAAVLPVEGLRIRADFVLETLQGAYTCADLPQQDVQFPDSWAADGHANVPVQAHHADWILNALDRYADLADAIERQMRAKVVLPDPIPELRQEAHEQKR